MEEKKKILIGIITYDSDWYCLKQFADSIAKLDTNGLETEVFIVDNSDTENYTKQLIKFFPNATINYYEPPKELKGFKRFRHCEVECRKIVKDYAVESDFDFLFFVDSDVICESNVLQKLVASKKEIVCGLFRYREPPDGRPLWFRVKQPLEISPKTGVWLLDFIPNEKLTKELMEIDACGFGAVLIKTDILKKIELRKSPDDHYGADINFCFDARKLDYKIFGDPTATATHLYKQCARRRESNAKPF